MSLATLTKSPADVLDYDVSFDEWLTDDDRINGLSFTIDGSAAAIDRFDYTDRTARVWVSGGAAGETAHINLTVMTLQGRTKAACFRLRIKECR